MALPATREEFIEWCLRKLGKPVARINVTSEQLDDRVDECLKLWKEYHYHAQTRVYVKHQLTSNNVSTGIIDMPSDIAHVVKVFSSDWGVSSGIFSLRYQLHLNDLWDLSSTTLSNYVIAQQYMSTIANVLSPESDISFQYYTGQLKLRAGVTEKWKPGQWIIIEAYATIDPETYPGIWADRILLDYGAALIKRQWGENLKKYQGIQLPGGTLLNGQQIWNEANADVARYEEEFALKYQEPPLPIIA